MEPPMKRARLLSDDSASDDDNISAQSSSDAASGAQETALHVNEEFAKRFQHNQERAEKHRLEEKYGKEDASSSDSDSESEDDEGELVTQELDEEIFATLNAIRNKDPRVYDKQSTFYNSAPEPSNQQTSESSSAQKEKPIHLRDYHRKNLLQDAGELKPDNDAPPTYADEQSALKRDLLDQMHKTTADDERGPDDEDDEGDFLVRKPGQESKPVRKLPPQELDIEMADKDPETYLSNFMASRAWVPSAGSQFQPFESDDDEEEARADEFEHAFNMRFEDPERANEKLISHSRDLAAKQSVRRDEPKGRKKARDEAKARRDTEKLEREEEKARLRRLKIDEAHEKWMHLQEAAGLKKQHLSDEKLLKFLEQGFEGENWDQEMAKLLGETYYTEKEEESLDGDNDDEDDDETGAKSSRKRVKKPKWDDDIDIGDIVPNFEEEEERQGQNFTLSDDDDDNGDNNEMQEDASDDEEDGDEDPGSGKSKVKSKDIKKKRADAKRESRLARRKIEKLVDTQLLTELDAPAGSSSTGPFRYRETSPTTLGLSARDILMASDSQLNQFAGLKKLATFRDEEKKARERKKLSKKARLKQWRKETFGDERGGDAKSFEDYVNEARQTEEADFGVERVQKSKRNADDGDVRDETGEKRKKKRKRSKKKSTGIAV